MQSPPPRIATLVLCTPSGAVLGQLPPLQVEPPWWQDAAGLVRAVREKHDVDVTVLRLLAAANSAPPGGEIVYLAEVDAEQTAGLPLTPWAGALEDHPLRLPYAEPGGPGRDLAWAAAALDDQGVRRTGAPQQVRTWNLSSLWRIPVDDGDVWLKSVPPFFAHEGAVLTALQGKPRSPAHRARREPDPDARDPRRGPVRGR